MTLIAIMAWGMDFLIAIKARGFTVGMEEVRLLVAVHIQVRIRPVLDLGSRVEVGIQAVVVGSRLVVVVHSRAALLVVDIHLVG